MASALKVLPNGDFEGASPTELGSKTVFMTREQYQALADLVTAIGDGDRKGLLPENIQLAYQRVAGVFPTR